MADDFLPPPPPGATKVQLEMWRRVIILRYQKIKNLPHVKFVTYYNAVALDLETSRLKQVDGNDKQPTTTIDLATGNFSSCLIKNCPDPTVPDVARHLTALFYRSIDNRLSPDQRRHGLDAVRRAFALLDNALKDKLPISSSVSQQQDQQQQQQQQQQQLTNITDEREKNSQERAKNSSVSLAIDLTSDNDDDDGDKQSTLKEGGNNEHTNKRNIDDIIPSKRVISDNGQKKTRIDTDNKDTGEREVTGGQEKSTSQTMLSTQKHKSSAVINEINSMIQVSEINSIIQASIQKVSEEGESKGNNDRTTSQSTVTTQPPLNSLPSFPPPKPICEMRNIDFLPDNQRPLTASASLEPRMSCVLRYDAGFHLDGSGATLDANTFISIRDRLEQWDPYWKVVRELGMREQKIEERGIIISRTKVGTRTTSCMSAIGQMPLNNLPTSCAGVNVELNLRGFGADYNPWGIRLGEIDSLKTGDRRLLLRMLPLKRSNYDKKHHSDNHQWPIGTFVQYSNGNMLQNKRQVLSIAQRRQQSHDPTLWKGLCQPLDMTSFLQFGAPFGIQICAKEVIEKIGTDTELTGSYAIHLAVCEYITSEDLFANLLKTIQTLSLKDAREMAKKYLQNQTVSIDSDSEVGDFSSNSSLTLSLLCPISKKTMKTAVRGRLCKHIQCFDLETFIHSNKHITGGRWRCGVCENFLSVQDLIKCGLYETILHLYKDTPLADKVSFKSDGSWNLKDEKKQLRGVGEAKREIVSIDSPQKKTQPEIIDLM